MKSMIVEPAQKPLRGELLIPGDKSISHRSIIFASLSEGSSRIQGLLEAEDVLCTIDCFREMGVDIQKQGSEWLVKGVGLNGLKKPSKVLWCGNSGTAMRLLLGILAGQKFESSLTGDASLNRRPMKRVTEPLSQMGAQFSMEGEGTAERILHVKGGALKGICYKSPVASAQVKSAILLAGLWAQGETRVEEPSLSRDHSEQMLAGAGVFMERGKTWVTIRSAQKLYFPPEFRVPADISSAAFFIVAALLIKGSRLLLKNIGMNPTRTGLLDILQLMGAKFNILDKRVSMGEVLGDIEVESSPLQAASLKGDLIPRLIDEIPILGVAAASAQGLTEISDAEELRVKESDRIQVLAALLKKIGVAVVEKEDGLHIQGDPQRVFKAAQVESFGDHRMAMSMAIAALRADGPLEIQNIDCVNTSFPSFWDCLAHLGLVCRIP